MRLTLGSAPHVKYNDSIQIMNGDIILALCPILVVAFFYNGFRAVVITVISALSCFVFEYLYNRILRRQRTVGDFSAITTGIIIAYCMPVTVPIWLPVIGGFFGIVIVKQLYGGIGKNIFNPAAAAIVFLNVNWQGYMNKFILPFPNLPWFQTPDKLDTQKTVLNILSLHLLPSSTTNEMLLGNAAGCIGSGCIIVILVSALYLLYRRIINWQTPLFFVGTVALFAYIFPRSPSGQLSSMTFEILSGSLIFTAIFMACDFSTSPVTSIGRILHGIFCGMLTVFMRYFGVYPESSFFALLLMNPFSKSLDMLAWNIRKKLRYEDSSRQIPNLM